MLIIFALTTLALTPPAFFTLKFHALAVRYEAKFNDN